MNKFGNDYKLNQLIFRFRQTLCLDVSFEYKKELLEKIFEGICKRIAELSP